MRGGVVAGGVVLMIIGLIFVSYDGMIWSSNANSSGGSIGIYSPQLIGAGLLFFGFILLIAGLAASSERRNQEPPIVFQAPAQYTTPQPISQNAPSVVLAICPNCKIRIPSESKFCPECGYVLHVVSPTDHVPSSPKDKQLSQPSDAPRFCESCGAPREDGNFCKHCGERLTP